MPYVPNGLSIGSDESLQSGTWERVLAHQTTTPAGILIFSCTKPVWLDFSLAQPTDVSHAFLVPTNELVCFQVPAGSGGTSWVRGTANGTLYCGMFVPDPAMVQT